MKRNRLTVSFAIVSLAGLLSLAIYTHEQSLALREIRKRLDAQATDDATAERGAMERLARVSAVAGAVAVRNEPPQRPSTCAQLRLRRRGNWCASLEYPRGRAVGRFPPPPHRGPLRQPILLSRRRLRRRNRRRQS